MADDWSPDGDRILAALLRPEGNAEIITVDSRGGDFRTLRELPDRHPPRGLEFSPDGRYVAYSYLQAADQSDHDVFILYTQSGRESRVVTSPDHEQFLGWAPDGNGIVFARTHGQQTDGWVLPVEAGRAAGNAVMVRAALPATGCLGVIDDGSLYFTVSAEPWNYYLGELDPQSLGLVDEPQTIESESIAGLGIGLASWSPDGRHLLFRVSERLGGASTRVGMFKPSTGHLRVFNTGLRDFSGMPVLGPDGRLLMLKGRDPEDRNGLFIFDIETNERRLLVEESSDGRIARFQWHPDGGSVVYRDSVADEYVIRRFEIASGEATDIYRSAGLISWVAVAPDGNSIAFVGAATDNAGLQRPLLVVPIDGGEPREIYVVDGFVGTGILVTPDSRYVYVHVAVIDPPRSDDWYRVAIDGSSVQRLELPFAAVSSLDIHPDGRRIVFNARSGPDRQEIWALRDFLPESGSR